MTGALHKEAIRPGDHKTGDADVCPPYSAEHEALIVRLSTELISCAPEKIDTCIRGALAEIGTFARVDRSYLFMFDEARSRVTNTHEWCATGVEPAIQRLQNLSVGDYPWVIPKILHGDVVHVPHVGQLTSEARAEREEWGAESIQSILLVPMKTSGDVAGYVGFDAVRTQKTWPEGFIVLLRIFGEIVLNALMRGQTEAIMCNNRLLASSAQRMQSLSRRLVEVREEEQRRLSADLHDGIGQNLIAISINLNIIGGMIPLESRPILARRLHDSQRLLEKSVDFARDLIAELRPPVLIDYGLLAALRWYSAKIQARTGMRLAVEGDEAVPRFADTVELALFRITQEALTNTTKYAQARNVHLRLYPNNRKITLSIADDGVGFDLASFKQPGSHTHWGLTMMHERAQAVGAHLRIDSAPGRGTCIEVDVERTT